MNFFRVLSLAALAGISLTSCAPTFSFDLRAGMTPEEAGIDKPESPSLSDIRDRNEASGNNAATPAKIVDEGDLEPGSVLRVKLQPNFGHDLMLCKADNNCESVAVIPANSGNRNSSVPSQTSYDGTSNTTTDVIADVELSDPTKKLVGRRIDPSLPGKKILIMPMDLRLSELSAGGLLEPNALWTSAARGYMTEFAAEYFQDVGYQVSIYSDKDGLVTKETGQDLVDLHTAVGASIFVYEFPGPLQLPTKKNMPFDWRLGPTTKSLKEAYGADLGLFVYVRDSYAGASRVAMQVLGAAFGVGIPGGQQIGYISLVDLETGQILWYKKMVSGGDIRRFEPAFGTTENLLEDIPL